MSFRHGRKWVTNQKEAVEAIARKTIIRSAKECWDWIAAKTNVGYGQQAINGRLHMAHRVMYEALIGPIPKGLVIDHLCRNRGCMNPRHMEPVTTGENVLRGVGITAVQKKKTHCKRGHVFNDKNTYLYNGSRMCKECCRMHTRKYARRKFGWTPSKKYRTEEGNA